MEYIILITFSFLLFLCLAFDFSILWALLAGLFLFAFYGIRKGFKAREIISFSLSGIKTVKNILITFVLIGIMTALWREAGTIPTMVCYAAKLISPPVFLLMTFLLNCLISVLTGTAFGTAATMGVICSTMGASLGVSPLLTGGAILSGVYFGDRCSPISTSALLVATLTKTDIFANIKRMLRSASIPFFATCVIYVLIGFISQGSGEVPNLTDVFASAFKMSYITVLPAIILLLLALFRVNVKIAMAASICTAIPICLFVQHTNIAELPSLVIFGYSAQDAQIASMLDGGGVASMLKVAAIVCLSSAYSGIFQKTGLLEGIKAVIYKLSNKTSPFFSALLTSVITGMIACNQTLTIMLTNQLCKDAESDNEKFAIVLEDTSVVIAALIPWSIASAVPLASVGAPISSITFACFLYLLPIWGCITKTKRK